MTAADPIAAAFVLTLWTWAAVVFVREWRAERRHKARVRLIAADTWARQARQQRLDDWQREVIGLFDARLHQSPLEPSPIFDRMHRDRFEADALAEIEDMTGGAS